MGREEDGGAPPQAVDAASARADGLTAADAYRSLAPAVLGYLRGQRVAEAEDLLGDVFVQVARGIGSFRGDEATLRRWVFTVARNCSVDDRRQRVRRPDVADAPVPDRPADVLAVPDPAWSTPSPR